MQHPKYTAFVVTADKLVGYPDATKAASLCWYVGEDFANLHMTEYILPVAGAYQFNSTGWDYKVEGPDVIMKRTFITFELRIRGEGCVARGVMPVEIPFKANVQMAPAGVLSVRISTGTILYPRNLMVFPDRPIPSGLSVEVSLIDLNGTERAIGQVKDTGLSFSYNGEPRMIVAMRAGNIAYKAFGELWEMAIGHARMFHKPSYLFKSNLPEVSILGMFWDRDEDLKRGKPTITAEARFLDDSGKPFVYPSYLKVSKKVDDYLQDSICPLNEYTNRIPIP